MVCGATAFVVRASCAKNVAACHLKLKDYTACAAACRDVLKQRPGDVKSLARLGLALEGLEDLEGAEKALSQGKERWPFLLLASGASQTMTQNAILSKKPDRWTGE